MKRSLMLLVSSAILVLAFASQGSAQGVVTACVKLENGQTRVVGSATACLPSETRVQWNIVGPVGPKGDPGPQGDRGPGGPYRLLDTSDRLVGVVLTATTDYPAVFKVLRPVDDGWVAFDVSYAGYSGASSVYYSDTSCSSADRYMSVSQVDFFRYGTVMTEAPGERFLLYGGDAPVPAGTILRSYRRSGMSVGTCTTLTTPITATASYRAVGQQLLDLAFPFRLAQQ